MLSSYDTQEGEFLRACCSDNCLFGQRETNATGTSLNKVAQANRYDKKKHYIPSVVFVISEANLPLATCKVLGYIDPDIKRMSLRGDHASDYVLVSVLSAALARSKYFIIT